VGLRAGLDRCGKSRPTGIRSPDRPARRQSLYRLRYLAQDRVTYVYISLLVWPKLAQTQLCVHLFLSLRMTKYRIPTLPKLWEFKKFKQNTYLKRAGKKMERDEVGGSILLGDNTDGGSVMLWPIWFRCVEVRISAGLQCTVSADIHSSPHPHWIPTCAKLDLSWAFRDVITAWIGECL